MPGPLFPVTICDPSLSQAKETDCADSDQVALTADFYKGDRSMRESGFDVTFRFGPFGADTHHYAPVCLNSLLYKTEQDLREMSTLLGRKEEAQVWRRKALERRTQIVKYLWDEHRGLFFDYDFVAGARSSYEYATTFYPLWAGVASKEQARAVVHNLALFEQPGGLAMSRRETQAQWDYPYGWAPIHLLAVEGLRRYGYDVEANRISSKFLATVVQNFLLDHTIREKYDVVTGSQITHIEAGYRQNVTGFGWTNGVFLELLHQLPPGLAAQLAVQVNKDGPRLKKLPQTPGP
jgi:alpha,alpha-trehalase